jgi:signal transduction histidine kinase
VTATGPVSIRPDGRGGDLLVVDDFDDARALYTELLSEDGHTVRGARSGEEALRMVDERMPELVLLDVSMPGMDGYEVLRRLREKMGGGPAVIMLTAARRDPDAIEQGIRAGADAYFAKPIEGRELVARVRGTLERYRFRRVYERERRDQIAMLVHDLRHPLSSISLVADLLAEERLASVDVSSISETLRAQVADMSRLIDGILAASRLVSGHFTVERRKTTVRTVLEPTLRTFVPIAEKKGLAFTVTGDLDAVLVADPGKLRQALDNVVANAIKFTPRGKEVAVSVKAMEGALEIRVEDGGPGIPAADLPTVFERYQMGTKGRTRGGAGLGLAIAKWIIEAHDGTIEVVPSRLGGAGFRIRLL